MPCDFRLRAEVMSREQLTQALACGEFEYIYAPARLLGEDTPDKSRVIVLPEIFLGEEAGLIRTLVRLRELGFTRGLAHTIGHIGVLESAGIIPHGGFRLNITNTLALKQYEALGLRDCVLSLELTLEKARAIAESAGTPTGLLAYGRIPLMAVRRCPISGREPCPESPKKPCMKTITDRKGNKLPLICESGAVEIFNPDILILSDKPQELVRFGFCVLRFTDETDIRPIIDMYLNNKKPEGRLTRGLYYRGVE